MKGLYMKKKYGGIQERMIKEIKLGSGENKEGLKLNNRIAVQISSHKSEMWTLSDN